MDTRFSVAIHTLILIAEAQTPMSSRGIACSTGTNASYIRKLIGLLKQAGMIESHQGKSGFNLCMEPGKISLMRIYRAIYETEQIELFDLHQNSNDACIVGRHIQPVLASTFQSIEQAAQQKLRSTTLYDCIEDLRKESGLQDGGKDESGSSGSL